MTDPGNCYLLIRKYHGLTNGWEGVQKRYIRHLDGLISACATYKRLPNTEFISVFTAPNKRGVRRQLPRYTWRPGK